MHGIYQTGDMADTSDGQGRLGLLRRLVHMYRHLLLFVALPTALVAFYYYAIASDQYQTEADFVIRRADANMVKDGMGQLLGLSLGVSATTTEAHMVGDYLLSHDAVARLRREDKLVERFHREGADWISRLWSANPTPERLLKFYRSHVTITNDPETGISRLRVHSFSPEDSYAIGRKLLQMGEEQINALNERTFRDQVAHSRRELADAEQAMIAAETDLTRFRKGVDDIDPEGSGKAQIGMVATLTAGLTTARARLQALEGAISRDSPQYRAAAMQVRALEAQIAGQSQRLAGNPTSIASTLGNYENLMVKREAVARRYAAASVQFEGAKAEAQRKQVYLIRIVDANRPVKSEYPERGKIVLTVFISLLFAFVIGWLLVAGIKEHNM